MILEDALALFGGSNGCDDRVTTFKKNVEDMSGYEASPTCC